MFQVVVFKQVSPSKLSLHYLSLPHFSIIRKLGDLYESSNYSYIINCALILSLSGRNIIPDTSFSGKQNSYRTRTLSSSLIIDKNRDIFTEIVSTKKSLLIIHYILVNNVLVWNERIHWYNDVSRSSCSFDMGILFISVDVCTSEFSLHRILRSVDGCSPLWGR